MRVDLVHLIWAPLGVAPFKRFLKSYLRCPAGIPHRLLLVFNGFSCLPELDPFHSLCENIEHTFLRLQKPVWDIGAYLAVARFSSADYLCFLNSHSEIVASGWLATLSAAIRQPRVGLVGAAGNYESLHTNCARTLRFSDREQFSRRIYHNGKTFLALEHSRRHFDAFPNPHIRTNSFMLARETVLRLKVGRLKTKYGCYRFESGRQGLTRQVEASGLDSLVVGADGEVYRRDRWQESSTFRSGGQANLLIQDNLTRNYEFADPDTKRMLEEFAWGTYEKPRL